VLLSNVDYNPVLPSAGLSSASDLFLCDFSLFHQIELQLIVC
jgi:hypothetical protein